MGAVVTIALLAIILKLLAAFRSSCRGARLQRMSRSSDPEIRKQAENSYKAIWAVAGFIIGICLLFFLWPVVLGAAIIWLIVKIVR